MPKISNKELAEWAADKARIRELELERTGLRRSLRAAMSGQTGTEFHVEQRMTPLGLRKWAVEQAIRSGAEGPHVGRSAREIVAYVSGKTGEDKTSDDAAAREDATRAYCETSEDEFTAEASKLGEIDGIGEHPYARGGMVCDPAACTDPTHAQGHAIAQAEDRRTRTGWNMPSGLLDKLNQPGSVD